MLPRTCVIRPTPPFEDDEPVRPGEAWELERPTTDRYTCTRFSWHPTLADAEMARDRYNRDRQLAVAS